MRVVAGKFRSRILKEFKNPLTRPTMDRVKEAIFSKIQMQVFDATVLDLFSGTGGLGIEALSRGAKKVIFVDKNLQAYNLIKDNLKSLGEEKQLVLNLNYEVALKKFKDNVVKFDIVLLDPPFNKGLGKMAIQLLLDYNLLNNDAIIVYECGAQEIEEIFNLLTEPQVKKYGSVKVLYYTYHKN